MKTPCSPLLLSFCLVLASSLSLRAAVLQIDPGTQTGSTVVNNATAPYAIAGDSTWNQGGNTISTTLYADGSPSGTAVAMGKATFETTTTLSFTGGLSTLGGTGTGTLFTGNPAQNSVFSGGSNVQDGIVGMRISGLAAGEYDIYVAGVYLGTATERRVGGSTPAAQAVWAFGGANVASLDYNTVDQTVSGTGIASQSAFDILENTNANTWTQGDNYARGTVTLAAGEDLYILTSGDRNATGISNNEYRGWMNLVQVVGVPEPASSALLALALPLLMRRRR
ncbi:MAG: hypothetical protein ACQKBY_03240 [Verrucomicrobiales bacterium]